MIVLPILLLAFGALMAQTPGTRHDYDIQVPAANDPGTFIPVSVFYGSKPGPTLVVTCGIHGFEFIPILAGQRLLREIDPKQLSGKVILVRLAHVAAFQQRSIFYNPHDGKNLNRVFPGSPLGTQSQRIAHAISELIAQGDLHIDMHGGDGTEALRNFVGVYGGKLASAQLAKSNEMASSFGLGDIVEYSMDNWEQVNTGRSCNRQAVAASKPTILVEVGERGGSEPALAALMSQGIVNVLRSQKMLPGAPRLNRMMPRRYEATAGASVSKSGIWYPALAPGALVRKGAVIGVVKNYLDQEIEQVTAPVDGIILYMASAPPVNAGEGVVTIAIPKK